MKHLIRQAFHSPKFVIGFSILMFILLLVFVYPLFVRAKPLDIIAQGSFFGPGVYVNTYDSMSSPAYTLNLDDAVAKRIANKLSEDDRQAIKAWLILDGIPENEIDTANTQQLLDQWSKNFDPKKNIKGLTNAKRNYYIRLDASLKGLLSNEAAVVAVKNAQSGALEQTDSVAQTDFVNISEVPNIKVLPLGTDNFGRDVLTEMVSATGVSLMVGLIAGLIATSIGLVMGLLAGFIGGFVDDVVMFFTNIFTVIPTFILLILISYSIGQEKRGAVTIAIVIGLTAWVWTARAVRSQVLSLRNRDHVNLSRISGHPMPRIIFFDILPYIMSYVIMALILQISSGILAEASLSILGLGPKTTEVPTLGLMMRWAMIYQAQILGKWWAYFPVVLMITMITFSMNLMNTGLDQVYNPALRE